MALVHPVNITYCVCAPHIILGTEKIVNRTQTKFLPSWNLVLQTSNIFQIVISVKEKAR